MSVDIFWRISLVRISVANGVLSGVNSSGSGSGVADQALDVALSVPAGNKLVNLHFPYHQTPRRFFDGALNPIELAESQAGSAILARFGL